MKHVPGAGPQAEEPSRRLSAEMQREGPRLRNFIRKRVADEADVEDLLQDVFSELFEAYALLEPVEQVSAWLFRVARNRITDLFRRRKTEALAMAPGDDDGEMLGLDELLPSEDEGPEAAYARSVLLQELDEALSELPPEQQEVFMAHEIEGKSFKQLAAETGLSINTLLSRKHYAVRYLRERLQDINEEFNAS